MRNYFYFSFLVLLMSCTETTNINNTKTEGAVESTNDQNKSEINARGLGSMPSEARQITTAKKIQQKCEIQGELLEENELWLKDHGKLICIIADSSTYDPKFGLSHRIIEVFNTFNCELELKLTLPVNLSPDYAYFLADINYNNESKIVAIKGAKTVYCLDLETKKMLPLLTPSFKGKRENVDANSGNIIRLELWEDFLVGFAQDYGTFVFDLDKNGKAQAILPFAEYKSGETNFNSLFLLASNNNKYQAILPQYDWEEETFSINPIFEEPLNISTDIQKSALDNQFIVLRQSEEQGALLVDMKARSNRKLPTELLDKPTKDILSWIKQID